MSVIEEKIRDLVLYGAGKKALVYLRLYVCLYV